MKKTFPGSGLAAFCLLLAGCASAPDTASVAPDRLRFHEWWNFYERGTARLEQKDYAGAAEDFETCLGRRSGARFGFPEERWRERTYGIHVIENYFPFRELGVCRYRQGEYARATALLEESLKRLPSGRAKYYLNLARGKNLSGQSLEKPSIAVAGAADLWTRRRTHTLTGTAIGPGLIANITVNGQPQFIELAAREQPFEVILPLRERDNLVTVAARDLAGQTARRDLTLHADWHPPQIVIARMEKTGGAWTLSGSCYDDQALQSVEAGGQTLYTAGGSTTLEIPLQLTFSPGEPFVIRATDRAGNAAEYLPRTDDFALTASGPAAALLAAGSDSAPVAESTPDAGRDRMKPVLRLANGEAVIAVYDNEFYLDGEALDRGGLGGIEVNGEEWLREQDRGAQQRRFTGWIPVEGTNDFTVTVRDLAGNASTRTFVVIRQTPAYLGEQFRLRVAIPPLAMTATPEYLEAGQIHDFIGEQIARPPQRFNLLARGAVWDQILLEQELTVSDLVNPQAALKIGRLMSADLLLAGSVFKNGDGLTICMKVVDAEKGMVQFVDDVYSEADVEDLRYQAQGLVSKIENRFPVAQGEIAGVNGQRVTIHGAPGIREGTKLIAIARDSRRPVLEAGQVIMIDGKQAELQVIRVREKSSEAEVTPADAGHVLHPGDFVCTR